MQFTAIGASLGALTLLVCFVGYWYIQAGDYAKTYSFKRRLTLYDLFAACAFFTQAILAMEVIGANGSVIGMGSENTSRGRILVHVHMFSQLGHLANVAIILHTHQHDRLRFGRVYYVTAVFPLWGMLIDRDDILAMGTIRAAVLVSALLSAAVYLYLAIATWASHKAVWAWFCIFAQVLGYCAMMIYYIVLVARAAAGESDGMTLMGLWLVHACIMLWVSLSMLWKFRRRTNQNDQANFEEEGTVEQA